MVLTFLACCLDSVAIPFGISWISHPRPDSLSQVWFRRTFITSGRPQRSSITIATTGYVRLYVNGRDVSTDAITPYRDGLNDDPIATTYDVTRFLRADTNTVAVWFSPSFPHLETRQIAVDFYGQYKDGSAFSYISDDSWMCRRARTTLTGDGGEHTDAPSYILRWQAGDYDPACWLNAATYDTQPEQPLTTRQAWYTGARTTVIRQQNHFDIKADSMVYDFGHAFLGMLRVTLRGARRGQHIAIGPLSYICSGEPDEQAIQRFTFTDARRIMICGDDGFNVEQIQKVEAMEVGTFMHGFN